MGARATQPRRRNVVEMETGFYTGDGVDDRNINIGIDLLAKAHKVVIIKATTSTLHGVFRTEMGLPGFTAFFTNQADADNLIQAFTNTGFEIGDHVIVNTNEIVYRYIAFWEEP